MTTQFVIECINKHEMQRGKRPVAVAISPENRQLGCPGATILVLQGIPVIHNEIMYSNDVWTEDADGNFLVFKFDPTAASRPAKVCECGADKVNSSLHSTWCPKGHS